MDNTTPPTDDPRERSRSPATILRAIADALSELADALADAPERRARHTHVGVRPGDVADDLSRQLARRLLASHPPRPKPVGANAPSPVANMPASKDRRHE